MSRSTAAPYDEVAEDRQVVGARAKARASQQMLDAFVSHADPLVPAPSR